MNSEQTQNNDAALSRMLREWKVTEPLPPRFREDVWRRIAWAKARTASSGSIWREVIDWMADVLPRPAMASGILAVALILGTAMGWTQSRQDTDRMGEDLEARYVRSVNPYLAVQ